MGFLPIFKVAFHHTFALTAKTYLPNATSCNSLLSEVVITKQETKNLLCACVILRIVHTNPERDDDLQHKQQHQTSSTRVVPLASMRLPNCTPVPTELDPISQERRDQITFNHDKICNLTYSASLTPTFSQTIT